MEQQKISMDELVQSAGWKKFMNKLNLYCAILVGILILMILLGYTGNRNFRMISMVTLMTLATTSFFMAYLKFESESKALSKWFYKIYGLGLSLGFVDTLYIVLHYNFPAGKVLIPIAIIFMSVSLFLGLREISGENRNKLDWQYFLRLSIGLFPLVYLFIKHNS
jgi:hypothetical protein